MRNQPTMGLSLFNPWGPLVVRGHKRYETRSWPTSFRGTIAILSSLNFPSWAKKLTLEEPFRSLLLEDWRVSVVNRGGRLEHNLPCGFMLGQVDVVGCYEAGERARALMRTWSPEALEKEMYLGDWTPGRFVWEFANPIQYTPPIPAKGRQGLFRLSQEATDRIARR